MRKLMIVAATAGAAVLFGSTAHAALLSIAPDEPEVAVPSNNNIVNAPGNITDSGVGVLIASKLSTTAANVVLKYFFTGFEAVYDNKLVLPGGIEYSNKTIDTDANANFENVGLPGASVATVAQAAAGLVDLGFRINGTIKVTNFNNPQPAGGSLFSIAYAYLDDTYNIVERPTNRVAILLDDSGAGPDDNHDDWVGYVEASAVPVPAAIPLFLSGLAGMGLISRRRANHA